MSGVEFYKAKDGWRWRARARNGRIVAESGEAYGRIDDAIGGADIARQVLTPDTTEGGES